MRISITRIDEIYYSNSIDLSSRDKRTDNVLLLTYKVAIITNVPVHAIITNVPVHGIIINVPVHSIIINVPVHGSIFCFYFENTMFIISTSMVDNKLIDKSQEASITRSDL